MTKQERDSRILMILLQFSNWLLKAKNLNKLTEKEKEFFLKVGEKRSEAITMREYAKLETLKEKYL